ILGSDSRKRNLPELLIQKPRKPQKRTFHLTPLLPFGICLFKMVVNLRANCNPLPALTRGFRECEICQGNFGGWVNLCSLLVRHNKPHKSQDLPQTASLGIFPDSICPTCPKILNGEWRILKWEAQSK
ncbi:MAG: hypothetical protein RMK94_15425, partial [Armatimonadota bacterium]|nr:hypothetical protein [Armatimonadota bacterium]